MKLLTKEIREQAASPMAANRPKSKAPRPRKTFRPSSSSSTRPEPADLAPHRARSRRRGRGLGPCAISAWVSRNSARCASASLKASADRSGCASNATGSSKRRRRSPATSTPPDAAGHITEQVDAMTAAFDNQPCAPGSLRLALPPCSARGSLSSMAYRSGSRSLSRPHAMRVELNEALGYYPLMTLGTEDALQNALTSMAKGSRSSCPVSMPPAIASRAWIGSGDSSAWRPNERVENALAYAADDGITLTIPL